MNDIVIYSSKRYLILMAAGCVLFAGASIYFLVYGYSITGQDSLGRFFRLITPEIFYLGIPFSILPLIYVCYRLLKPTPSVIINREGLFDNASAFGAGMIRWEEIDDLFVYKVMDNSLLGITPVNIETVLARQSGIKRFFFKMGKGMSQAPFAIPEGGLPMTVEELLEKIELYRESLSQNRALGVKTGAD